MYMDINNVKKYPIDDLMIYLKSALKVGDVQTAAEISKFMTKNNLRYAEALFLIGNFYLLKENNDIAKGFYSRIIVECPNSPYLDLAKIKLTEMYIKDKNYTTAITQIKSIANKKFTFKKKALLALVYLESKKIKESEKLTRTIFYKILNDKHGEILIKKLFLYYYKKKNLIKFRLYSNYLNRFRGNQILINKLSARFYYYAKNYSLSFFYYYRLSTQKVELDEAFFFLGKISLLYHRNKRNAMRYLTKVIKDKKSTNMYKYNALYELAILAKESRNNKKSKEYLKKIISTSPKREIKEKAKNLLEYYKF